LERSILNKYSSVKLSVAAEIIPGFAFKSEEFGEVGTTAVKIKDITPPTINTVEADKVDITNYSTAHLRKYELHKGDFVVAMTGATIGKIGKHVTGEQLYINQRVAKIEPRAGYSKEFVYYAVQGRDFLKFVLRRLDSSSAQGNISGGSIGEYSISCPGIETQRAIGSVLTALDAKIELNNRINEELEGMAKLLYDYWFVQFDFPMTAAQATTLGKPHLTGQPYRASGGKMIYNKNLKRDIPEGWTDGSLEKLGKIIGGSTPSTEVPEYFSTEGTPWITPKDLSDNVGNRCIQRGAMGVTEKGIKAASLKLLPSGTVLMSSRAPIGYLAVAGNSVTTNQGFKSFVPENEFTTDYIYFTLKHFMKLIQANASGSTFKEISGGTLKAVKIHLPPAELVKKFTEFSSSLSSQQSVLERLNLELTRLRDWLLPMLMNGQVTVN
jgi:type I restriction enzyme, S subunit